MCDTRVEAIDERLRDLGYPDRSYSLYHEDLLGFARNFAAEADKQEKEIERQAKDIERLQAIAATLDLAHELRGGQLQTAREKIERLQATVDKAIAWRRTGRETTDKAADAEGGE